MLDQSFVYTRSGTAADDFMVTLPTACPNDTYLVTASLGGVTNLFAIDLPNSLASDRTTTQFRVVTSAPVLVGDKIEFQIYGLVSRTLALHPFASLAASGWAPDPVGTGSMKSSAAGTLYIPIALTTGDRITGVTIATKGPGGTNLTMKVYVYSGSGGKTSLGTLTWAPTTSWVNTALGLTATTLAAGQSLYFEFSAVAANFYLGTASVHYDRT